MELRIIDNEKQLIDAKDRWTKVIQKMEDATPFQAWEWNYYWWKHHKEGSLLILEAVEIGETFGFAPLVIRESIIQFIGDVHFDYGMFVCAERKREIVDLFFNYIERVCREAKYTIHLTNIPIWSDQYSLFRDYSFRHRDCIWRELVDTANVKLTEYQDFSGYLKAISASLRKKAIKPCIKAEGFEYKIVSYSDSLWNDIEEIYQYRMEDRVGRSTLDWAKYIVSDLNHSGMIKISLIEYQSKAVAFLIFYEFQGKDYVWLTAFKKTEAFQLGHYIRYKLIEHAYQSNIGCVDMMRGAYEYKKQWDCNTSSNWELVSFRTIVGKIKYRLWKKIRPIIKQSVYSNKKLKTLYQKRLSKI